jgi:peptide/nickel transport system ATP-binding protein
MNAIASQDVPAKILELRNIRVEFGKPKQKREAAGAFVAVDGVTLEIARGEIVALIGASGSGKTTTARVALGLQSVSSGDVHIFGRALGAFKGPDLRVLRRRVQFIFQDPSEALNPRMTVRQIISEGLEIHGIGADRAARTALAAEALVSVELAPASLYLERHFHTLSGGQRQRVAIAAALALSPDLLVADEPVSMLDLSIRAGVLNIFRRLRAERNMSTLLITHDLTSVGDLADRVMVMNKGTVVEEGTARAVLRSPEHPYTRTLLAAVATGRLPSS